MPHGLSLENCSLFVGGQRSLDDRPRERAAFVIDLVGGRTAKRQPFLDSILKKVFGVAFLNKTKLEIPEHDTKKGYKMAYKIKGGRVEVKRNGDGWSALDKINFLAASPGTLQSVVPKTWEKMTDAGVLVSGDDSGSDESSSSDMSSNTFIDGSIYRGLRMHMSPAESPIWVVLIVLQ